MYLDKPMRDHTLLQAICRTNRPYGEEKTHGLIVDYIGVFDDVAQAIQLDEEGITKVVSNIAALVDQLPAAMGTCLAYFEGLDRTVGGYEGLIAAQERLPNNETRDQFGTDFSFLSRLWEAISPDPVLGAHETDYRWLSQVYESVKPSTGNGRLIWHALGPKTISLIHENIHVDEIVRVVRFEGWQNTYAGERAVKKALRKTLFKYRLHQDADLFNRSYGYIRQYY